MLNDHFTGSSSMNSDTFLTIERPSEGYYREKGSKFVARVLPVTDQDEIKAMIESIRKEFHDARHHCYAYMLGYERNVWRVNDDGEPSGTAGKPILGQINSNDLTNILIVVSRYFGGTLLGVSGLINAYRSAAASAISNGKIIKKIVQEYYEIKFPYIAMNDVMRILKEENAGQSDQSFDTECRLIINFRLSLKERVMSRFARIEGLVLSHLRTR